MDQTRIQRLKALVEELEKEVASESLMVQELFQQLKRHIDTLRNFTHG